eukprot:Lithocolla_globosa_v1_NODE_6635_length_1057_cov_5.191617.p3 type:complete len:103 gc:universal NODE_6635_length_1057_cov_5.191617:560-868(+)
MGGSCECMKETASHTLEKVCSTSLSLKRLARRRFIRSNMLPPEQYSMTMRTSMISWLRLDCLESMKVTILTCEDNCFIKRISCSTFVRISTSSSGMRSLFKP